MYKEVHKFLRVQEERWGDVSAPAVPTVPAQLVFSKWRSAEARAHSADTKNTGLQVLSCKSQGIISDGLGSSGPAFPLLACTRQWCLQNSDCLLCCWCCTRSFTEIPCFLMSITTRYYFLIDHYSGFCNETISPFHLISHIIVGFFVVPDYFFPQLFSFLLTAGIVLIPFQYLSLLLGPFLFLPLVAIHTS